jgi:hypothetical protein
MAFQMNLTLNSGIEVQNAYVKISYLGGNKGGITLYLNAYVDQDAMNAGMPVIEGYSTNYNFVPTIGVDSPDFISQGYNYLKTLPDFQGVTDILE